MNRLVLGDVVQPSLMEEVNRGFFGNDRGARKESIDETKPRQESQRTPGPDVRKMIRGKWMVIYDLGMDRARYASFDTYAEAIRVFRSSDKFHPATTRILFDPRMVEQSHFGNAFVLDKLRCQAREASTAPK